MLYSGSTYLRYTTHRGHREYTDMSCCRISKQELVSPWSIVMVVLQVPPPVIVCTSFGTDRLLGLLPQYSNSRYDHGHAETRTLPGR
ncbi:hypothetical protein AVEN_178804-1 [Araneus ventricosus]|uniref:Uncharacterized protein n=1 Tax=Araneus ventricosus TaxID=182803 RepID=A0A4Y2BG37_ARAVE|nr:hypothetical protein AVEN_178804-1 [Araneus ventricosus]